MLKVKAVMGYMENANFNMVQVIYLRDELNRWIEKVMVENPMPGDLLSANSENQTKACRSEEKFFSTIPDVHCLKYCENIMFRN